MPKSCAARQCCNRYSNRRKQLTFHRFPFSRPELLKEWVLNIGRGNFKPKQHTVICSEHFRPECFSAFGNRKNLKHNAVPTVFAFREPTQVLPAAGPDGPGRSTDAALEELQLPPDADAAGQEVVPATRAGPQQPSDHSYALRDLAALKNKLFRTLRENDQLRRRLRAQRRELRRLGRRLRAQRGRRAHVTLRAPRPGPRPASPRSRPGGRHRLQALASAPRERAEH